MLDRLAQKWGFTTEKIAVAMPGNEQQAQWLQIRQMRPDYVILLTYGVSNPTALKTAARTGFPAERIVGWWWSGAEEDVVPAGDAAKGFVLLPRRWVVERTFAWLGRCRRLAKDWEKSIESSTAWTTIAHIRRLTRLIATHCQIT